MLFYDLVDDILFSRNVLTTLIAKRGVLILVVVAFNVRVTCQVRVGNESLEKNRALNLEWFSETIAKSFGNRSSPQ